MPPRRTGFAVELESAGRGRRAVRMGRFGLALLVALAALAVAALAAGVVELPSRLSSSLQTREMDVLLARRVQLGERLRLLAARFDELGAQVRQHEVRIQRIRGLYGLPALAVAPAPTRFAMPKAETIFTAALLHVAKLDAQIDERLSATDALLVSLSRWELEHRAEAVTLPARLPIRSIEAVPTAVFGPGRGAFGAELEFHAGIDLAAPRGTTIVAPASGIVRWAGEAPPSSGGPWWRLGRTVVLAHGESYRTLFGHCERILVRSGQRVEAGQPIATVGSSGRAVGPRLHYEVRRRESDGDWRAIDPAAVLLDLDRLAGELGSEFSAQRSELDPALAPPLPAAYRR